MKAILRNGFLALAMMALAVPANAGLLGLWAKDSRDACAECMTPDQIAEAQLMAREWMAKHQQ